MSARQTRARDFLDTDAVSRFEGEGGRLAPASQETKERVPAVLALLIRLMAAASRPLVAGSIRGVGFETVARKP